ncbi:MAG: SDR family oxidoreductase, partial [Chitinophagales bacterium]
MKGKVVIITGSSIGIGRKMAVLMGQKGAKIVLNARNAKRLETTRKALANQGLEVFAVVGDVSKEEDCEQLIKATIAHYGKLDVLVNNAGIAAEGTVEGASPSVFKKVMDVNYLGSVYPTHYALPHLRASKGNVLFISSAAGIHGIPNFAMYSASKMALTALAESLKIELHGTGVHVGIAYVGFTENDSQKTIYDAQGNIVPQPSRDFITPEPVEV